MDSEAETDGTKQCGSGYCEHGSTGPCPDCDGAERCDRCGDLHPNCQTDNDGNPVCPPCIIKESKRHAREGEQGQGQRPIGEQRAIDRAERCGSGWPR